MNGQNRADVKIGTCVSIVLKADQRTGKCTEGIVARLLTNWDYCDHGEDGGHWVDNGWWEDQGWWMFDNDQYSTYGRRTHFTPIWYPDGSYTPHTWLIDSWTPDGMLSLNLTDSLNIRGKLWSDWHIAPQKPN